MACGNGLYTSALALTNETFSIQGMAATVILYGYDDGVCELVVDMGQYGSSVVDQGTFEVSAAMKPTFTFDTAGEITGTPDYGSASAETGISITAQYTATTSVGAMDLEMVGIYNPKGISSGDSGNDDVEVLGTVTKGDGMYTCNIVVSGNDLGVEIRISELAESGEVTVACGGGTMTCTYTYDGTYLTLAGGDDASGYLVHFKDAILGTWEVAK